MQMLNVVGRLNRKGAWMAFKTRITLPVRVTPSLFVESLISAAEAFESA